MSRLILQPCASPVAFQHYQDTVVNRVPIQRIAPYLQDQEIYDLNQIYPSGDCMIWGVVPGKNDVNVGKWNRIQPGDITLFAGQGRIFSSAVTTYKIENIRLANQLWGTDSSGQTWQYIYFLDELRNLNIPYIDFNLAVGYAPNNVILGFDVLDLDKSRLFFRKYDIQSDTYDEDMTEAEYKRILKSLGSLDTTEEEAIVLRRREQIYLKKRLFGRKTTEKCACCNRVLPVSFLVTAHIKKRAFCTDTEKRDPNIVFPMCKLGCDEIFEKGYIGVENGSFIRTNKIPTTQSLNSLIDTYVGSVCRYYNQATQIYFQWHLDFHS